jgi:hypothetical protein
LDTLISNTGKLEYTPPIEKLIYSFVLFLIFVIYFLELNKDFYLEAGNEIDNNIDQDIYKSNQYWVTLNWQFKVRLFPVKKTDFTIINKLETVIYYLIILLLVLGFIVYGGEIHDTLRRTKNLTLIDIITDTNICRLEDRKSLWYYLKVGLGVKI